MKLGKRYKKIYDEKKMKEIKNIDFKKLSNIREIYKNKYVTKRKHRFFGCEIKRDDVNFYSVGRDVYDAIENRDSISEGTRTSPNHKLFSDIIEITKKPIQKVAANIFDGFTYFYQIRYFQIERKIFVGFLSTPNNFNPYNTVISKNPYVVFFCSKRENVKQHIERKHDKLFPFNEQAECPYCACDNYKVLEEKRECRTNYQAEYRRCENCHNTYFEQFRPYDQFDKGE